MKLDAARSRLAVYTFAEGLFSALAHDLELVAAELSGSHTDTSAEVRVAVGGLGVSGVMKKGKIDKDLLSSGDVVTIERQIHEELFHGAKEIVARGTLEGRRASIEVTAPRGTTRVACDLEVTTEGEAKRARGQVEVSLAALGLPPVKGPLGAFRVKDRVRVEIDLVFVP